MNLDLQYEGQLRPVHSPSLRCKTISILRKPTFKGPYNASRTVYDEKRELYKDKQNITNARPDRNWEIIKSCFGDGGHGARLMIAYDVVLASENRVHNVT